MPRTDRHQGRTNFGCTLLARAGGITGRSGIMGLLVAGLIATSARASVIEYQFSGVITSADPSTGVAAGTPFSGTFSYDPSTLTPGPGFEGNWEGTYGGASPSGANLFSLQIGGQTIVQDSGRLGMDEDFLQYAGQYGYTQGNGSPVPAHTTFSIGYQGSGALGAFLTLGNSESFFAINPNEVGAFNLGQLPDATLQVIGATSQGPDTTLYQGTLTSLMTVPLAAPEPGLAPLAVAGALWLATARRRRNPAGPTTHS